VENEGANVLRQSGGQFLRDAVKSGKLEASRMFPDRPGSF
jgi:hypothetical protein